MERENDEYSKHLHSIITTEIQVWLIEDNFSFTFQVGVTTNGPNRKSEPTKMSMFWNRSKLFWAQTAQS